MKLNGLSQPICLAALASLAVLGPARAATGTISANPNPCVIPRGAQNCTTYVSWSTQDAQHVRVFVRSEGLKVSPEREFAAQPSCANCGANWIEPGTQYIFTLVDFSSGSRGGVLANVIVTAADGPGPRGAFSGVIIAAPNPCRIEPGRADCTTYLSWSSTGEHARVYVRSEGAKVSPEKEFATGRAQDRVSATWIVEGTRYVFTLVDFSSGSRGRELASVTVGAVR